MLGKVDPDGKLVDCEPSYWVRMIYELYMVAKVTGIPPAAGGMLDQEWRTAEAFRQLSMIEYFEEIGAREAIIASSIRGRLDG